MRAGQNNRYDITQTSSLVQFWSVYNLGRSEWNRYIIWIKWHGRAHSDLRRREVVLAKISLYMVFVFLICHSVKIVPNIYEMAQTYLMVSLLSHHTIYLMTFTILIIHLYLFSIYLLLRYLGSLDGIDFRDHPFKTSACLRGGEVSPCTDGQKVTLHKDEKSLHKHFAGIPMVGG